MVQVTIGAVPYRLEANSERVLIFVQNLNTTSTTVYISDSDPTVTLGAAITYMAHITLAAHREWWEANKELGWPTEQAWWIYIPVGGGGVTIELMQGFKEPSQSTQLLTHAKPGKM